MPYNYQGPNEQDPRYEDIMRILGSEPLDASIAQRHIMPGRREVAGGAIGADPIPTGPGASRNYEDFMPQPGFSPSGIATAILMLLGGGTRPGRGLPTGNRFPMNTQIHPGGGRNFASREAGTPGALPEKDFIQPLVPESYTTPTGRPRISEATQLSGWMPDNPGLNTIFRNMPDFPQSVPRNLRDTPQTPYPGTTQGMARRRGVSPINWEQEVPRIVQSLEGGALLSDVASSLRVNIGTVRQQLTDRGHTIPSHSTSGYHGSWLSTSPVKREEIAQAVMAGRMSAVEGAKALGVSTTAVHRLVQRRRQNPEGQNRPLHRNLGEIRRMEEAGISYDRIAAQFGVTAPAVRGLLQRQGVYGTRENANRGRPAFVRDTLESIPASTRPSSSSTPISPASADAGIASMMRDSEQRMLNQRMSPRQIAESLRREYNFNEQELPTSMVQHGNGWWRRMR